jgi:hypothetical protein
MPLDPTIVDDVANTNFKVIAGTPASLANTVATHSATNAGRMLAISADAQATSSAASGMLQKRIVEVDAPEAEALATLARSSDPAEALAQLLVTAVGQILSKTAGNTPPVTP